jgi:hypothetical protein
MMHLVMNLLAGMRELLQERYDLDPSPQPGTSAG